MPPSKNWHWKNARAEPFAKEWLSNEIMAITSTSLKPTSVDVDGDCEVGMRKSKIVYDLVVRTEWSASEDVTGTLTCPELGHDMAKSEYVFETSVSKGEGKAADDAKSLARTKLADEIREVFDRFHQALLDRFGFLMTEEGGPSPSGSGTSTPASASAKPATASSTTAGLNGLSIGPAEAQGISTTSVRVEADLQVTADDLFDLLTDGERKVPMWTRNPAQIQPVVGSEVSLFAGNIRGKVTSVSRPKRVVMSWRAPTWPADHYGELTITIDQGADSTKLTLALSGVPTSNAAETERNLDVFYIRSLKQIGYVEEFHENWEHRPGQAKIQISGIGFLLSGLLPFLLSFGLIGALVAAIWLGPTGQS